MFDMFVCLCVPVCVRVRACVRECVGRLGMVMLRKMKCHDKGRVIMLRTMMMKMVKCLLMMMMMTMMTMMKCG